MYDWIVMRNIASPQSGCYDFLFDSYCRTAL